MALSGPEESESGFAIELDPPRDLAVIPGPGTLTVQWDDPEAGAPTGSQYRVQWADSSQRFVSSREQIVDGVYQSAEIEGLLGGVAQSVRVRLELETAATASPWATTSGVPGRVPGVPDAPEISEVAVSFRSVSLRWDPPADDGGSSINSYSIELSAPDSDVAVGTGVGVDRLSYATPPVLDNGVAYRIEVWAENEHGRGQAASVVATPVNDLPIRLAFASDRSGVTTVHTLDAGASTPVRLTGADREEIPRGWSPDRSWVLFDARAGGDFEIHAFNVINGEEVQLTCNTVSDWGASWSPDGTKIAFSRRVARNNHDIYLLDVTSGVETRLTSGPSDDNSQLTWSPDGTRVAFNRGPSRNREIWTMSLDGQPTRLVSGGRDYTNPSWSPDGRLIAYTSGYGPDRDIAVISPDGGDSRPVTTGSFHDDDPAWTHDGSRIVFARGSGSNRDIYTVDIQGGDVVPLVTGSAEDRTPRWSPDIAGVHFDPVGCEE